MLLSGFLNTIYWRGCLRLIDHISFTQWRKLSTKWKDSLLNGRRYLQMYLWWGDRFPSVQRTHTTQQHKKKKKWTQLKNGQKTWIDIFQRRQMANRYTKRWSTLLIIRDLQVKTTMRYHVTSVRRAIIKKTTNTQCWWRCAKREPLCTVGGGW